MTDQDKKAAVERMVKRIVIHGKKTNNQISEHEARKKALKAQRRHKINTGD